VLEESFHAAKSAFVSSGALCRCGTRLSRRELPFGLEMPAALRVISRSRAARIGSSRHRHCAPASWQCLHTSAYLRVRLL
jgi:hypothetical protein